MAGFSWLLLVLTFKKFPSPHNPFIHTCIHNLFYPGQVLSAKKLMWTDGLGFQSSWGHFPQHRVNWCWTETKTCIKIQIPYFLVQNVAFSLFEIAIKKPKPFYFIVDKLKFENSNLFLELHHSSGQTCFTGGRCCKAETLNCWMGEKATWTSNTGKNYNYLIPWNQGIY